MCNSVRIGVGPLLSVHRLVGGGACLLLTCVRVFAYVCVCVCVCVCAYVCYLCECACFVCVPENTSLLLMSSCHNVRILELINLLILGSSMFLFSP